jgi:hypothetical protein
MSDSPLLAFSFFHLLSTHLCLEFVRT